MSEESLNKNTGQLAVEANSNSMATAGLVLALVTLLIMFIPFVNILSFVTWVLAVIFSSIGISKAKKLNGKGKGMAIAGLVISLVSTLILIILIFLGGLLAFASVNAVKKGSPQEYEELENMDEDDWNDLIDEAYEYEH